MRFAHHIGGEHLNVLSLARPRQGLGDHFHLSVVTLFIAEHQPDAGWVHMNAGTGLRRFTGDVHKSSAQSIEGLVVCSAPGIFGCYARVCRCGANVLPYLL